MDLGDSASRQKSPLGSTPPPGLFDANRLFGQVMFPGHPPGLEHFSAVPHVPSAFSMFGHPGYSLVRPTGSEFGGLGNLHSLTEAARLQALCLPTSMAGHNPLSSSAGWSFEASAQLFSLAALGTNPWWQHAAHGMVGLGHEFYASSLGAAASPTFGLAAAAAAGKEESSSPKFESLLEQIKSPKAAKMSPTSSSGSKASTHRRVKQRKSDSRPASLSPPATSTSITASPPSSMASKMPPKDTVSVIKQVPKIIQLNQPPSTISSTPKQEPLASQPPKSFIPANQPPKSSSAHKKLEEPRRPSPSSDSISDDDDDDDDIAESDSNDQSDVSSGDDSGSNSDPDSDDKEMANLMATKKQLEAQQREILHQKALELLRKKKYTEHQQHSPPKPKKLKSAASSPLELLKEKHILHEQALREQEQKRRAAELTLHFEQQIKQQQQQLRLQKKALAEKERDGHEKSDTRTADGSRKEHKHSDKKHGDTALDMSKGNRNTAGDMPMALNLKVDKKKTDSAFNEVNGKRESSTPVSTFSSLTTSPTPSSKSSATDSPIVAKFRGIDSDEQAESDKAGESEDEEESEISDDSQEVSSDSGSDLESDSDNERNASKLTDVDSEARDSESSPVPNRLMLSKRQLIESMIDVPTSTPRKRMRVTNEEAVRHPLDLGWRRQVVIRQLGPGDRVKGDVIYYAPCGKKLRTYPEVTRYIERRGITTVSREHFSFSAKIRVGEFLNPKPGENGIVFEKLSEEELQNCIDILCNRKPRNVRQVKAAERRRITQELARRASMVKQRKKLEQQEMARRIAEAKMRRKMERQSQLQAQRDARRQQALQMAEAKKREKNHRRMLKDQQKMVRVQQLRMERDVRNHQIIEERRKKKAAAENQKVSESLQKAKEREIRRQHAVLMKHQDRERRKQHMMLVRALEARKKAEVKERAKQEKKMDKKVLKEKKYQQQQTEFNMARELKKPVEDMKLHDEHRPLPVLERIKNIRLPGKAYADCLMVLEFLHNFGEALLLDDDDIPSMTVLQAGLFNEQDHIDEVITLTVQLLSLAVDDPGLTGDLNNTFYGEKLDDVIVTENNMSEIMRLYLVRTNGEEDELSKTLIRLPYRALTAVQKTSTLAFLVNQLVCNQSVMQQIDVETSKVSDLRRDKWVVEGKLRKLRVLQSKKFGKKSTPKKNPSEPGTSTPKSYQSKPHIEKTPGGADDEDEKEEKEEDEDDDEKDEEEDEEEEEGGGEDGGAASEGEEDTDGITLEEIQKKIEKLQKQHSQFRSKIFDASHSMRATTFGQDRFKRQYWVLPHAGGIFVEGMESSELSEDTEVEEKEIKAENGEIKKGKCELKASVIKRLEPEAKDSGINGDLCASTSQEVPRRPEDPYRTGECDRTMGSKTEMERKFEKDLEGLIDRSLSADKLEPSVAAEYKEDFAHNGVDKTDIEDNDMKDTYYGSALQNGPADLSKRTISPTKSSVKEEHKDIGKDKWHDDKDKQGFYYDKPLSLDPKREVSSPSKASTPSKSSTPSHISTPSSSTRDVSSPSWCDSKSGFMNMDSILHRGTTQPYVLANPYAAATSAASPVIGEQFLKGIDTKPNGTMGSWFSILPRLPCDDQSLTRTKGSNSSTSSSESQVPAEIKHTSTTMPFNVSPYGLYQMPFPLMHMNQMNPLMTPYVFPGFGAVPMQSVPAMNGPLDLSNSMMPVVPHVKTEVKTEFKTEIKNEEEEEEEEEEDRESQAIAQMKVMLDEVERAVEKPIPKDLQEGWWQITNMDQLRYLMRCLQPRGIRERILQKTLQKYSDFCGKACKRGISDFVKIEDETDDDDDAKATTNETDFKEILFAANKKVVMAIEQMEEKVYCASMQVKGWVLPDKVSGDACFESCEAAEASDSIVLNIIIRRLEALERAVERRYLKPPLTKSNPKGDDDISPGLIRWRNAVASATSASQIFLAMGMLENSIAWDKSIMKVFCQLCRKGDNEALLLLCDGCDKGFHTYCFKPKMEKIPEGDWYCSVCVSKATGEPGTCIECQKTGKLVKCNQCPRAYHLNCLNPQLSKMPRGKWLCPPCEKVKRKAEKKKKKKSKSKHKEKEKALESGPSTPASIPSSPADATKPEGSKHGSKKHKDDMAPCKQIMNELDKEENAWPFLLPVNTKQFASYRKIIKKPMDLSTLRNKMHNGSCRTHEDFATDIRLIFDNCVTYNEDESEVGQAGHDLRAFFERRWPEVLKEYGYLAVT